MYVVQRKSVGVRSMPSAWLWKSKHPADLSLLGLVNQMTRSASFVGYNQDCFVLTQNYWLNWTLWLSLPAADAASLSVFCYARTMTNFEYFRLKTQALVLALYRPQIIHDLFACTEGASVNCRLSSRSFVGTYCGTHWLNGLVSNILKT